MLCLEQPPQPCLAVFLDAQQFSVLLPHRWIVGLGLETLTDGTQRRLVLRSQVIGLGKVILRVSVAGKNPKAVLQQLNCFFALARSQFVLAYFEQEIGVVRRKLQSFFKRGSRLGDAT